MPTPDYNHVISEIKDLNLTDQLRLLEEIAGMIRIKASPVLTRSILELQGKGKELWKNINIKQYIDEERSSWNG